MSRLATTAVALFVSFLGLALVPAAQAKKIAAYPSPGVKVASPTTQISFRGIKPGALGRISVRGSRSGIHRGRVEAHSDGRGASFLPFKPFQTQERVTVYSRSNIFYGTGRHRYSFATGQIVPKSWRAEPQVPARGATPPDWTSYKTFRYKVPDISIKTSSPAANDGLIFLAPRTNGPMIVDREGNLVYYDPGLRITDFRVQRFRGKPVLTWWRRAQIGNKVASFYTILNRNYKVIKQFHAGNGYTSDPHEFTMAGRNTAFVNGFRTVVMDLRRFGGLKRTPVMDNVAQEIDLKTGLVMWEWHSIGNVRINETYMKIPRRITRPFDYFHLNSIERDKDGNMLLSARHARALYKVNRLTGKIMWRMAGKKSDFKIGKGMYFAYQHDFRREPDGTYSLFDNGAGGPALPRVSKRSKGIIFRINQKKRTTTLVQSFYHPEGILSNSQGNTQVLPDGNVFVGWGDKKTCTEYNRRGNVLFDLWYSAQQVSYRCYSDPWVGTPPASQIAVRSMAAGDHSRVWVSWNGDTRVATWRVLAGNPGRLAYAGQTRRDGFETTLPVDGHPAQFRLIGLDASGKVIGRSKLNKLGQLTN